MGTLHSSQIPTCVVAPHVTLLFRLEAIKYKILFTHHSLPLLCLPPPPPVSWARAAAAAPRLAGSPSDRCGDVSTRAPCPGLYGDVDMEDHRAHGCVASSSLR
jgi:hypothetical protein